MENKPSNTYNNALLTVKLDFLRFPCYFSMSGLSFTF